MLRIDQLTDKMIQKILHPKACKVVSAEAWEGTNFRLIIKNKGTLKEGLACKIYLIVDESDGIIADLKYQCFGPCDLIAALEGLVELSLRKTYLQASRITFELLDRHLRDRYEVPGFHRESIARVQFLLEVFYKALEECEDIPLDQEEFVPPPNPIEASGFIDHRYPNFIELSLEEKRAALEEVIEQEIRPYIQLDAGNIEILEIKEYQIKIRYLGSCTSCYSATGSTLQAIQQILKAKVHPSIQVQPDLSTLSQAIAASH